MSTDLGTPETPEERGPRAPSPGNGGRRGGRSPGRRRAGRMNEQRRLAPRFLGLPGWGGAGTAKVAVADLAKPGRARPATHLSRVDRRADWTPALPRSTCGPQRVAGARPLPQSAGVWWPRAGAGAGRGPGASLPRLCSLLAPSLADGPGPAPARGSLSALGSGPGTQVPRQRERVGLQKPEPSATFPSPWSRRALRSGTKLGGAQRALFPRFPKGHPGGGAP